MKGVSVDGRSERQQNVLVVTVYVRTQGLSKRDHQIDETKGGGGLYLCQSEVISLHHVHPPYRPTHPLVQIEDAPCALAFDQLTLQLRTDRGRAG